MKKYIKGIAAALIVLLLRLHLKWHGYKAVPNLESALANGQLENANKPCKRILQIIQQRNQQCRLLK